jgi:hypothetical protein
LTSCKTSLTQKTNECDELQKENQELQLLVKSTTDCLEEQLQYQQQQQGQRTSTSTPPVDDTDVKNLQKQLLDHEKMNRFQDEKIQKYEMKLQRMQQSIDQLKSENEALKASSIASLEQRGSSVRANSPVNLVPRNKPNSGSATGGGTGSGTGGSGVNSFQRKTPPRSARRLMQISSPTNYGETNKSQMESPRQSSSPPNLDSRNDLRRHSSYTTGDYVVSYAMRQNGNLIHQTETPDQTEDPIPVLITPKKVPKAPQELATHPYYPHSATASILWQETIAQQVTPPDFLSSLISSLLLTCISQKPYDSTVDTQASRDRRSMELKARRNRHSFEDRSDHHHKQSPLYDKIESPDQTSQVPTSKFRHLRCHSLF